MKQTWRKVMVFLAALLMILFGLIASIGGYSVVHQWHFISAAYAACGVAWVLAGLVIFVAGWELLASRGRRQIALWMGGTAIVVAGAVQVAGVLAHLIPCSGPS
jgi:TRAP-type C4-dicarboxylate transport system permease small subunit